MLCITLKEVKILIKKLHILQQGKLFTLTRYRERNGSNYERRNSPRIRYNKH